MKTLIVLLIVLFTGCKKCETCTTTTVTHVNPSAPNYPQTITTIQEYCGADLKKIDGKTTTSTGVAGNVKVVIVSTTKCK